MTNTTHERIDAMKKSEKTIDKENEIEKMAATMKAVAESEADSINFWEEFYKAVHLTPDQRKIANTLIYLQHQILDAQVRKFEFHMKICKLQEEFSEALKAWCKSQKDRG